MLFGHYPKIMFCHSFHAKNLVILPPKRIYTRNLVHASTPTVFSNLFETLHVFRSWSEYVHIVWALSSDYFLLLFPQKELTQFSHQCEKILGTLCVHLLLQFSLIPLKRYRCIGYGLKIFILLGHNPQIFLLFLSQKELSNLLWPK